MESLFQSQETRLRDSRGRFATRERAYVDKAISENKNSAIFAKSTKELGLHHRRETKGLKES